MFRGRQRKSKEEFFNKRFDRMPRKRCNLPVKVRSGELSVHPGSEDPVLRGDAQEQVDRENPAKEDRKPAGCTTREPIRAS